MSYTIPSLDTFTAVERPWIYVNGWPEPLDVNDDTVSAVIFTGGAVKDGLEVVIVRADGTFLDLMSFGQLWLIRSGVFAGSKSKMDTRLVRLDPAGKAVSPRRGIGLFFSQNLGAEFTAPEAITIALNFSDSKDLPRGTTWWREKGKS